MAKRSIKRTRRLIMLLACIALAMGLLPATASAEGGQTTDMPLTTTTLGATRGAELAGGAVSFGGADVGAGDQVYLGSWEGTPIAWDVESASGGSLAVYAHHILFDAPIHEDARVDTLTLETSDLYTSESDYDESLPVFRKKAFTDAERAMTGLFALSGDLGAATDLMGVERWLYWFNNPLEKDNSGIWYSVYTNSDGSQTRCQVDDDRGVRPVSSFDLEPVLFSSAAESGKSGSAGAGGFAALSDTSSVSAWKFTLLDPLREVTASATGAMAHERYSSWTVPVTFSGGGTGPGDYVSAILCDADGNAIYYGTVASATASGTQNMAMPAGLAEGTYTLKVFSEQRNGDQRTDYAGPFVGIELTVGPPLPEYTVKFVDEDGSEISTATYTEGTAATDVVKPADPTKASTAQYAYEFAGWEPEIAEVTGDATYTAKYTETPRLYTVKWLNDDGTEFYRDVKVPYGTMPKFEGATPTKPSDGKYTYEFAGWEPEIAEVTGDATYTAKYRAIPRKGTLTFDLAGGTLDGKTGTVTVEANVGDTINLPGAPTKKGYAFKFWKGSEYAAGAEYKVEGDHAFTAEWVAVHTVAFDANGHGKAPDAQEVEHGGKAKRPANPTADGWTFGGWYTDKACKEAYDFSKPVTSDVTLYAKWTKKSSSGTTSKSPKTGDPLAGAFAIALALAAASALALAFSRRMRHG